MHVAIVNLRRIIVRWQSTGINDLLNRFCCHFPSPLTLKQICDFAIEPDIDSSFKYVKNEIAVRLTHGIKEIMLSIKKLPQTAAMKSVLDMYCVNLKNIARYENSPSDARTLSEFDVTLKNIVEDLREVVEIISNDSLDFMKRMKITEHEDNLCQFFLDRILCNQISIRTICQQHRRAYKKLKRKVSNINEVFSIYEQMNVDSVVQDTYHRVSHQFHKYFKMVPELEIRKINITNDDANKVLMTYFPINLIFILKELFKNSIFASCCHYKMHSSNSSDVRSIMFNIVKADEDITIVIKDKAGGARIDEIKNFFKYGYTTNERLLNKINIDPSFDMRSKGFGLPMSKTYARYFCGDIDLASVEGEGTTVFIYLKASEESASEVIPVYNHATIRTYNSIAMPSQWV